MAGKDGEGVTIEQVVSGSPADRAKLKVGEVICSRSTTSPCSGASPPKLNDLIDSRRGEGTVVATLRLAEKAVDLKIKLDPEPTSEGRPFVTGDGPGGGPGGGQSARTVGGYWTKPSFRLAIVCVEYPDVEHNPQITNEAWTEALFSEGTYNNKANVTGQAVHGSFRDYFIEQSCGYFRVDGKVFDWIQVSKKREEYATGNPDGSADRGTRQDPGARRRQGRPQGLRWRLLPLRWRPGSRRLEGASGYSAASRRSVSHQGKRHGLTSSSRKAAPGCRA